MTAPGNSGFSLRNILWWFGFTVIALWGQTALPGVDLLVAGLIVSLQEGRLRQSAVLGCCFLLINEGAGSLAFGAGLAWYMAAAALFVVGRWLFEQRNILFIALIGVSLGLWRYALLAILATLQEYRFDRETALWECVMQALAFPVAWAITSALRPRQKRAETHGYTI